MSGSGRATGHPALTDPATGLANALHFDLVYGYLFGAGDRGVALTVMHLHVDDLGSDGDRLKAVGDQLSAVTRASDLIAHMGEGRFVLLLLGSNLQGGMLAADRMRSSLEEIGVGSSWAGLAAYQPEMKESSELLDAAEHALDEARKTGSGIEIAVTD